MARNGSNMDGVAENTDLETDGLCNVRFLWIQQKVGHLLMMIQQIK
ncbi:MAG: hypothetical protein CM15mV124_370 [uncultured marine virus]|nr:MAG: hypothetical protein CM15mV124_370 [uncultured marine virus]